MSLSADGHGQFEAVQRDSYNSRHDREREGQASKKLVPSMSQPWVDLIESVLEGDTERVRREAGRKMEPKERGPERERGAGQEPGGGEEEEDDDDDVEDEDEEEEDDDDDDDAEKKEG